MHKIEPYFKWRDKYSAEHDKKSPFYEQEYNETQFHTTIYNYYIHPQWDTIGSDSLYVKLLFTDYEDQFAIIELFGEWNDAIGNDVRIFLEELISPLSKQGINKFILIGENLLNFHGEIEDYYSQWYEDVFEEDGWIVGINFPEHVVQEMSEYNIPNYIFMRHPFDDVNWRKNDPETLFMVIEKLFNSWLSSGTLELD